MIKSHIKLKSNSELDQILKGNVFHVTPTENMLNIEKSKAVLPNLNNKINSLFGNSVNSFFRLRGCVSLFDYREYGSEEWEAHAHKCIPTLPLRQTDSISILFLSKNEFPRLVSWEKWKEEEKWSQRVVPHVEVGYPGPIPLRCFTEHLIVVQASS